MKIKRLVVGRAPSRRLGAGLLVSGLAPFLALAGTAPANAATLTENGNGLTVSVVSAQLVNKVAVNVKFSVTCTTTNAPNNRSDVYFIIAGFTLSENVKGTIVSYQGDVGSTGNWPYVNCDGTPQLFTVQVLPSGPTGFKAGPAYMYNGSVAAYDSEASCGINYDYNFPNPCDYVNFDSLAGGVQITG